MLIRFLEMLLAKGFDVVGFDPTYAGDNPRITKKYFQGEHGARAAGFILRHVLEHIQDPVGFLFSLRNANGGQGRIYIEVPAFDWICDRRAWFDIFYEHVNYFRLADFRRIFGSLESSGTLFGGQYLYVVADLATLRAPALDPDDRVVFPHDFTRDLTRWVQPQAKGQSTVIWGGASKGVVFALLCERLGAQVSVVIDVNPAKQGAYMPGTGLRIHSPEEALSKLPLGSTIYVMNSNYLSEIQRMSNNAYRYISVDHG